MYQIIELAGKPFRPANGMAGEAFQEEFCERCRKQADCQIIGVSMCFTIYESEYPQELTHTAAGEPVCTAFQALDYII